MLIRNFLQADYKIGPSHKGVGTVRDVALFKNNDFESPLNFFHYTEIPPGSSIGYHRHGTNEEVYVVLEGRGVMTVNGESREVKPGDVIVNKQGWSHGLENRFDSDLKIIVYEADMAEQVKE